MSGMPLAQTLVLFAAFLALITLVQARWLHAFLAIVAVATVFGLVVGFSTAFVGKAFGAGFAQAIASPGLAIVAAGFVAAIAEATGASVWLAAKFGATAESRPRSVLPTLCGLVAGLAASPATAFAVLTPLLRAIAGETVSPQRRGATAGTLALALSASHGLALVSPIPIAAAAILGAPWSKVALFGIPLAVLLAVLGAAWSRWLATAAAAVAFTRRIGGTDRKHQDERVVRRGARGRHRRPARAAHRAIARRHSERAARRRHRARIGDRRRPSAGAADRRHRHHGDRQCAARPDG